MGRQQRPGAAQMEETMASRTVCPSLTMNGVAFVSSQAGVLPGFAETVHQLFSPEPKGKSRRPAL